MSGENKIPSGWVETILDDVCYKVTDGSHQSPKSFEGGKPMLSVKDMREFGFDFDNCKTISTEDYERLVKQGCKPEINDILIAKDGSVLKHIFRVNKEIEGVLLSSIAIVKPNTELIDPGFLVYLLVNPVFKKYILNNFLSGSGVPRIVLRDFKKIIFFLPSLPEQQAIASILTTFDDKIELLQAQNQTLEATAQTIFKEWFGKYQVGDELPEGWRVGKLGDIINLYDFQRIPLSKAQREERKGEYRYYGATSVMDYIDDYIFDGIYLLFAEDGSVIDENGNPILQYVWGKFWLNNHAHIIQGKNGFSTELLYVLCKDMRVDGIISGAVQLKINQRNLLGFDIVIPKENLLQKLDNLIQPIFEKVRTNNDQIQTLQQTRDTLLPKLMSGKLRVDEFRE